MSVNLQLFISSGDMDDADEYTHNAKGHHANGGKKVNGDGRDLELLTDQEYDLIM